MVFGSKIGMKLLMKNMDNPTLFTFNFFQYILLHFKMLRNYILHLTNCNPLQNQSIHHTFSFYRFILMLAFKCK